MGMPLRPLLILVLSLLAAAVSLSPVFGQGLEVKLVSVTSPVSPGDDATITVQTAPGATCLITVRYKSGPSKARGLSPKAADSQGRLSWTWRVGSRTSQGTWPITVTCNSGGQQATLQASFVVR